MDDPFTSAIPETAFTAEARAALAAPLNPERVSVLERQGQRIPYISHREAVETANRIFGFGNWGFRVEGVPAAVYSGKSSNDKVSALWGVAGTLTVRGGLSFTDVGTIEQNGEGVGAVDMAWKGAASNALVRCLRHYGDQFGLVLYDKSLTGDDLQHEYDAWRREQGDTSPSTPPLASSAPAPSAEPSPPPPQNAPPLAVGKAVTWIGGELRRLGLTMSHEAVRDVLQCREKITSDNVYGVFGTWFTAKEARSEGEYGAAADVFIAQVKELAAKYAPKEDPFFP